ELYTYSATGQDVVLVNARLAVIGRLPALPAEGRQAREASLAPPRSRRVYIERWIEVPVYDLAALPPGHELKGPAIVASPTTTIRIRLSELGRHTPEGWLAIHLASA